MMFSLDDSLLAPFREFSFMRRALVACFALALGSGPVGVFLLLRRMSLMSDAMIWRKRGSAHWSKRATAASVRVFSSKFMGGISGRTGPEAYRHAAAQARKPP